MNVLLDTNILGRMAETGHILTFNVGDFSRVPWHHRPRPDDCCPTAPAVAQKPSDPHHSRTPALAFPAPLGFHGAITPPEGSPMPASRALVFLFLLLLPEALPAAAPPRRDRSKQVDKTIREVAGSAEYLRSVPKRFGVVVEVDARGHRVKLLFDGDKDARTWPLADDAEVKVSGWWGRLDQLAPGERVWTWLRTDRKNVAVAIAMLADDLSQQDIHGVGVKVEKNAGGVLVVRPEKGPLRTLKTTGAAAYQGATSVSPDAFAAGNRVFVQGDGEKALVVLDPPAFERRRAEQRQALRKRWLGEGLPGSVAFVHTFSGEMDLMLDHEAMRWGRSLRLGDKVSLAADPPIPAVVKSVQPWRERTRVRVVAKARDLADLKAGQRLSLRMSAPPKEVEESQFPPDMDRPRSRPERIEWFLASIYCTCGVRGDVCTGHFYTLASCNPNGCGMPNQMRKRLGALIDKGLTDRQVLETLLKEQGPGLLQPHLLP
jgi:hypothetical protein